MAAEADFWGKGISIQPGAPPAGDVIFIPCDEAGSPSPLNTYILESLELPTSLIPDATKLRTGYAIVHRSSLMLVFVVTETANHEAPQLLGDNLLFALGTRSLQDATTIWLPLIGMAGGGLMADESLAIIRHALELTGWSQRSDVSIVIAPPADVDLKELEASATPFQANKLPRTRARRKGAPPEARTVDASVFYASPSEWDSEWLATLRPGKIMFWIKNGDSHLKRFRRGHAVVLLAGRDAAQHPGRGAIVAFGVQAAGPERRFEDDGKNRRWPVTITHVFDREQFPRSLIEDQTGLLLRAAAGGVHSLDSLQTEILSLILASAGVPPFPLNDEIAEALLARGQSVEEALVEYPYIHEVGQPVAIPDPVKIDSDEKEEQEKEPPPSPFDAQSEYLSDTPAHDVDLLDRGEFAVALARRLHDIWCRRNGLWPKGVKAAKARDDLEVVADDTFIVHVDAPWGGGKTTFANFVAQVLNPRGARLRAAHFLNGHVEGLEKTPPPSLDGVFLGDYSPTEWEPHPRPGRRPWIIVRSNAWRYQDVEPPWWQIHLDVAQAIRRATLEDFRRHAGILASRRARLGERTKAAGGMAWSLWRWARAKLLGLFYQVSNTRLVKHLALTVVAFGLFALSLKVVPWKRWTSDGAVDPAKIKALIEFGLLGLGALGGGLAAFGTLLSQSLAPDLDFSGETKRIGVGDPIARFRKTFRDMLELGRRPVLLIVDDLDRCAPKHVVELLRGFQTILQSPRMFVMILGDRHWIETAHSVWHADMKGLVLGPEASLGARFVEKVFQLSFVLPAMSGEARDRYTRAQLGDNDPTTDKSAATPPTALAKAVETALNAPTSASEREKAVHALIEDAKAGGDAEGEGEVEAIQAAAASRITVEAVGDVELTGRTEKLLAGLAPLLPNNPRQIKRVINAFPLFAAVGAKYFGYRGPGLLSTDDDTRAWRQLALWVALSTEWPVTWRALAARPLLLDAAYAPEAADRDAAIAALSADGGDTAKAAVEAEARRLQADPALARLLGSCALPEAAGRAAVLFGATRVEPAAVRQFNRIIWEAGFDLGETLP